MRAFTVARLAHCSERRTGAYVVVLLQDAAEEPVLGGGDRLDDEAVIGRKVEERAALSRRPKLGQDIAAGQGHLLGGWPPSDGVSARARLTGGANWKHVSESDQIVAGINVKVLAQLAEDPRRIVLELEVVLGRRRQLIARAVCGSAAALGQRSAGPTSSRTRVAYMSNASLCAAEKSLATGSRPGLAWQRETCNERTPRWRSVGQSWATRETLCGHQWSPACIP